MRLEDATILVVDDEPALGEIFSAWFLNAGCKVFTASNGVEALAVLEAENIGAVVSDIRMPVMDGVSLVRTIHKRQLQVPSIIFVSGFGDAEPREMYGLGVEAMMEKPVNRKALLSAVQNSLLEFDHRWLTAPAGPTVENLAMEFGSLTDSIGSGQFQLGRGGCSFSSPSMLREHGTIALYIRFVNNGVSLNAQGKLVWFDQDTRQAGMIFEYLDPECRQWVIADMRKRLDSSFIPQCRPQPQPSLAGLSLK